MKPVSPSLLQKMNESLQTIGNNADPQMQVVVSRAKNTIQDADYWTVETIRETSGLGDISVAPRRFKSNGSPNRLYGIHVHNGEVKTLIREYPDKLKRGWVEQFILGLGSSVAVAFNGHWERYRSIWGLITDESPFISWVDNNGDLWTQKWDNILTKFQLASGVKKVRMIRAWKNTVIHHYDQGVVAAYIKNDGKVYYRNYCDQEDYTEVWEAERQLTGFTGTAVNVNLFITNDYRMGFIIEDNNGKIHWLITQRNWGGMASPVDNVWSSIKDVIFDVIPVGYYKFDGGIEKINTGVNDIWFNVAEPIYPQLLSVSNDDRYTIRLLFNHLIDYDLSNVKTAFSVKDSTNVHFNILSSSSGVDNSEIVLTLVNFNGAKGNMFVTYDRNVIELDCLNQGSRFAIEGFTAEFTPELVPLEVFESEHLNTSIVDVSFTVKQVYYNNRFEQENIISGITDVGFIVTKVGSSPL